MAKQSKQTARQKRKPNGPSQPRRLDDLGQAFPNDWLEAVIVLVAAVAILGGAVGLYYLSKGV